MRFVVISKDWTNINQLRGSIYPTVVCEFYMGMSFMSHDTYSHHVIVCDIQFKALVDVITMLLGLRCVFEVSSMVYARVKVDMKQVYLHL